MNEEKRFNIYLTVLRFLTFKITSNLRRIYMDIDIKSNSILLTAYYFVEPSNLELELLDDIETNCNAHIPNLIVNSKIKLMRDYSEKEKHDFIVFSFYEE